MNNSSISLSVKNVTVSYRNGHRALWNASFEIPYSTITALVGVNGAGKSTLFKAIMGFLPISEGTININGKSVSDALKTNLISYVPQSEEVDWSFPVLVKDVVMMGRYGHMGFLRIAKKSDHFAVEEALSRVGMLEYSNNQIGELSGGQRKRLSIAMSLLSDPKIILMDEPFQGLDIMSTRELQETIVKLQTEDNTRSCIISDHAARDLLAISVRAIILANK